MNAIRKFRVLALVALLAVVVLGVGAATAEAGGGCHYGGGYGGKYVSYKSCYYPSYNYCSYPSYNYCNYGYDYSCYYPSCYYPKTCSYPVTSFDCYGRPYTFWQTGYGSVPVSYLP